MSNIYLHISSVPRTQTDMDRCFCSNHDRLGFHEEIQTMFGTVYTVQHGTQTMFGTVFTVQFGCLGQCTLYSTVPKGNNPRTAERTGISRHPAAG